MTTYFVKQCQFRHMQTQTSERKFSCGHVTNCRLRRLFGSSSTCSKKVLQRWNLFRKDDTFGGHFLVINGTSWLFQGSLAWWIMMIFSELNIVHSLSMDMMNWWNMWEHSTPEVSQFTLLSSMKQASLITPSFWDVTRGSFDGSSNWPNCRGLCLPSLQCQEVPLAGSMGWWNRWLIFFPQMEFYIPELSRVFWLFYNQWCWITNLEPWARYLMGATWEPHIPQNL